MSYKIILLCVNTILSVNLYANLNIIEGRRNLYVTLHSDGVGQQRKKILINHERPKTITVKFVDELIDNKIDKAGIWYWRFVPKKIIFKLTTGNVISNIDFVYSNMSDEINSSKNIINNEKQYFKYGSLFTLFGMAVLDDHFAELVQHNIIKKTEINTDINYYMEDDDNNTEILFSDDDYNNEIMTQHLINLYDSLLENQKSNNLAYCDFPSVPTKSGLAGRRQRIWIMPDTEEKSAMVIMDLKLKTPRFGKELVPYVSEYISFSSVDTKVLKYEDVSSHINTLLSLVHITPSNISYDHNKFQNHKIFRGNWKWRITLAAEGVSVDGEVMDDIGGYLWLSEDEKNILKRVLEFTWETNFDNLEDHNLKIYLPTKITFTKVKEELKIDFVFSAEKTGNFDNSLVNKSMKLFLALFVSGGFIDIDSSYVYADAHEPKLKSKYMFRNIVVSAYKDADSTLPVFKDKLHNLLPSAFEWVRIYSLLDDHKYYFESNLFNLFEHAYFKIFRAGNYGFLGLDAIRPKFLFSPHFGVRCVENIHDNKNITISMYRENPSDDILAKYFEYIDRPIVLSARDFSFMDVSDPIHKDIIGKLSNEDLVKVRSNINILNISKQQWSMKNVSEPGRVLRWKDIESFLPMPKEDFHRPLNHTYKIGPVDASATYGYD